MTLRPEYGEQRGTGDGTDTWSETGTRAENRNRDRPVGSTAAGDRPPSGLQDGSGRDIDGARTGHPGGNAIAILSRVGATVEAIASRNTGSRDVGIMAIADALLEQDAFGGLPAQSTILREETLSYCTLRSDDTEAVWGRSSFASQW